MKVSDKTGMIFGYWTVIGNPVRSKYHTSWLCKCVCGTKKMVIGNTLTGGKSKSCGCKQPELSSQKNKKHGMAGTRTYKSWHAMLQRSQGKGGHGSYVERKIDVCKEWLSFEKFYEDMGKRPERMTLDRIDNTKGYSKENCRWATSKQQANNRDKTLYVTVDEITMPFVFACEKYGISQSCARHRIRNGMTHEQTFKKPSRKQS